MLNVSGLGLSGLFIVFMLVVGCVMKSSPLVLISKRETFLFFNYICIYYVCVDGSLFSETFERQKLKI